MFGYKYNYEMLDDNKIKLAPTKGTYIAALAATVALPLVASVALKIAERREAKRFIQKYDETENN